MLSLVEWLFEPHDSRDGQLQTHHVHDTELEMFDLMSILIFQYSMDLKVSLLIRLPRVILWKYLVSSASFIALANATVHSQRFRPQEPGSSWHTADRFDVTESSTNRISYVDKWLHSLKFCSTQSSTNDGEYHWLLIWSHLSFIDSKTSLTLMEF